MSDKTVCKYVEELYNKEIKKRGRKTYTEKEMNRAIMIFVNEMIRKNDDVNWYSRYKNNVNKRFIKGRFKCFINKIDRLKHVIEGMLRLKGKPLHRGNNSCKS